MRMHSGTYYAKKTKKLSYSVQARTFQKHVIQEGKILRSTNAYGNLKRPRGVRTAGYIVLAVPELSRSVVVLHMRDGAGGGWAGNSIEKVHLDRPIPRDLRALQPRVPGEHVTKSPFNDKPCLRGSVRRFTVAIEDAAANVDPLDNRSNTGKRVAVKSLPR